MTMTDYEKALEQAHRASRRNDILHVAHVRAENALVSARAAMERAADRERAAFEAMIESDRARDDAWARVRELAEKEGAA